RKVLRKGNSAQLDVEVVEIDILNNTLQRSITEPVTGDTSTDPYETKSRTILLRDLDSEAEIGPRVPVSVNAFELPRTRALELGQRTLRRLKNPLMVMPVTFPSVLFAIDRGSVISGQTRDGYTTDHFVTGLSINGDSLGTEGHRIMQTIDSVEL